MRIVDLIMEIGQRIKVYENTAEDLYQEYDDPDRGDQELAKAEALTSLLEYINENFVK